MKRAITASLSVLLGLAAAAALTAEAEGCRYRPGNRAYEPIMASTVRAAPSIFLARAVGVRSIRAEDDDRHPDMAPQYLYDFAVLETIKGERLDNFQLLGYRPYEAGLPQECLENQTSLYRGYNFCSVAAENEFNRQAMHLDAERRDEDWHGFYYISPFSSSGMGRADTFIEDLIVVECGIGEASFEIGETFLIFYSGENQRVDRNGLNHLLVSREDDAWVEAVRYLVSHPEAQWLEPRGLPDLLKPFGLPFVVEPDTCEAGDGYEAFHIRVDFDQSFYARSGAHPISFWFEQRELGAAEYITHCEAGGAFLAFHDAFRTNWEGEQSSAIPLFPIRDGVVDFSHLPTQRPIAGPTQLPLAEVLQWHTEPPQ